MKKAFDYVRKNIDTHELARTLSDLDIQRVPFSFANRSLYDEITDLLEEYGEDNDLCEGWYLEEDDLEELILKYL